ncbi:hypothetical protein CC1G_04018 [Coprinopsis cinerea okayama7|uniref:Uncharacterized protein n=1 Tax=Coprinopsis cinerea (strain Okayama-7 / 130 / ATCC MYA-4618 / FGSC 9003) TaxID=240176 RepID=A8N8H1_COPC7|nr:hypothetical protein CC1G_04018 [Coprinopsis cinerea okayama7\|eukprot:XP_001831127.2 hypothetical protein CC1G_04018 [Coprinopsis cinerea okayama7\
MPEDDWRLPREIIFHILDLIISDYRPSLALDGPQPWGLQDPKSSSIPPVLKAISLTCRALCEYTRPFIFETIRITPEPRVYLAKQRSTMEAFAALLRHSPHLARYVENLVISASKAETEALKDMGWRAFAPSQLQRSYTWSKVLEQNYPDLKWLVLDIPIRWVEIAPDTAKSLTKLLESEGLEGLSIDARMFASRKLRLCKSLKYFRFDSSHDIRCSPRSDIVVEALPASRLPALTLLDLSASIPATPTWLQMIQGRCFDCSKLERCRIGIDGSTSFPPHCCDFLHLSTHTLTHIEIYFRKFKLASSRPPEDFTPLNLSLFKRLKVLVIAAHFEERERILDWLFQSAGPIASPNKLEIKLQLRTGNEVLARGYPLQPEDLEVPPSTSTTQEWESKWSTTVNTRAWIPSRLLRVSAVLDMRKSADYPDDWIVPLDIYHTPG